MRALVCSELGPAELLELRDVAEPEPGPGEVVVDVRAAALNFPDTLIIEGKYQFRPEPPFTPGGEAAGVVSAVGPGVDAPVGMPVVAIGTEGAFAEKWVVPARMTLPKPETMSFAQAAGFTLVYGTSYYALKQRAGLAAGETLLVLGAAGGAGSSAVELGKAMGATVIAAASTDDKLDFARSLGADEVINYASTDLRAALETLTAGTGPDVVYDPVGGALAEPAFRSIGWGGRYLVVGFAAGDIPALPLNLPLLKGASIVGVFWGQWMMNHPDEAAPNIRELYELAAAGTISPRVGAVYALEEYEAAFAELTRRNAQGKVVLAVSEASSP